MNSKQLILLPLLILSLGSCTPNTNPKPLSYNDAINYIKKNSKTPIKPTTGYVEYTSNIVPQSSSFKGDLEYLGVNDLTTLHHKNEINSSVIDGYYDDSNPITQGSYRLDLPLMYLNETNFKEYVKETKNGILSYSLTYIKEFVIYHIVSDDLYYTRYYNTDLRLYKFEVHRVDNNNKYDLTQLFSY